MAAGFFGMYRYLMLPISFPALAVVLIWQFTTIWHPVAGADVRGPHRRLPTIIVYLALGKFFRRGLLAGSVKG